MTTALAIASVVVIFVIIDLRVSLLLGLQSQQS